MINRMTRRELEAEVARLRAEKSYDVNTMLQQQQLIIRLRELLAEAEEEIDTMRRDFG